ncbi:mediator of RNA polymerase II transcription subunit 24 isoform X1 [Daktulosphaira vitifoliae]|uniref:mediator of RNA polymerase II transcription subunit 24 isoform X1 n=1 Tax=Daktulosphaira vitifoliae TaxID=58002 RepID=UPI0021A9A64C|nr:mediator of RNA polymerase II transcription subunit 24 isoform X1 [Daktulosphaira vitifoliae]
MEVSKVTSKTSSLKSLVLKAWGERWTEIQWGISIKSVLPRGVSGDVYNLADIILSQALVGSYPNELVLSYLRHSLNCQLVSYAAILQRISKYDKFYKRSCVIVLLDFLKTTLNGITCRGKPEESVLPGALLSLADWLLSCIRCGHSSKNEVKDPLEKRIIIIAVDILESLLKNDFILALLYLAKHEDPDLYLVIVKKCQDISQDTQNSVVSSAPYINNILISLCNIDYKSSTNLTSMESVTTLNEPITYVLQPLLAIRVMLNPTAETQVLVDKLKMIRQIKSYSNSRLYCELIRACLMCLRDSLSNEDHGPQWGAFTFIKLPHIIKQLCKDSASFKASEEVIQGFEMLLDMFPLLDFIDSHTACSSIELLLRELIKQDFVTESQCSSIISQRASVVSTLSSPDPPSNVLTIIMRTEPTLQRMLRTLDSDFSKIQEALVGVLSQALTGTSLELILAAAAVEGKLRMFVAKLIKFNEFSKHINLQDSPKLVRTNAVLFDMTFLMLCFITQKYGYQAIFPDGGNDTFFEKWYKQCMVEHGNPKSHENVMGECDPGKVEALLTAIDKGEDIINCDSSWDKICLTIIGVTHDVVVAWENSTLSSNDVKRILDSLRTSMLCLPICAAAWLCSYMQVLHQDASLKPMNMVQQLLNVVPETNESQDNYSECRQVLMCEIIRKMQQDLHPPTMPAKPSHNIVSKDSILEQLIPVWEDILEEGWLNVKAAQKLRTTLFTAGADWFVNNLIKEMMKLQYRDELEKAVDLLFAIFHFDVECCTLALLELMPQYLFNPAINVELIEPQQTALAKLCSYCIYASVELQQNSIIKNDVHKSTNSMDIIDIDNMWPPKKIMRMNGGDSDINSSVIDGSLQRALIALFRRIAVVASRHEQLCQETHFVLRLLEQLVLSGRGSSQIILKHLPPTVLPNLIRCVPDLFTVDLILNIYDLNLSSGRNAATSDLCLLQKTRCSKNTE